MIEIWKPVIGYEDILSVSNFGRVHSKRSNRILKQYHNESGYMKLSTSFRGKKVCFQVHRMVAEAFLGVNEELTVNHKNGCKSDNYVDNLEWLTLLDNIKHANDMGLTHHPSGEESSISVLTESDVRAIRAMYKPNTRGCGKRSIAKVLNLPVGAVDGVIQGRRWKHII